MYGDDGLKPVIATVRDLPNGDLPRGSFDELLGRIPTRHVTVMRTYLMLSLDGPSSHGAAWR